MYLPSIVEDIPCTLHNAIHNYPFVPRRKDFLEEANPIREHDSRRNSLEAIYRRCRYFYRRHVHHIHLKYLEKVNLVKEKA